MVKMNKGKYKQKEIRFTILVTILKVKTKTKIKQVKQKVYKSKEDKSKWIIICEFIIIKKHCIYSINIHEETLEDIILKQTDTSIRRLTFPSVHNRSTEPKISMNIKTKIKNIISKVNLIDTSKSLPWNYKNNIFWRV